MRLSFKFVTEGEIEREGNVGGENIGEAKRYQAVVFSSLFSYRYENTNHCTIGVVCQHACVKVEIFDVCCVVVDGTETSCILRRLWRCLTTV